MLLEQYTIYLLIIKSCVDGVLVLFAISDSTKKYQTSQLKHYVYYLTEESYNRNALYQYGVWRSKVHLKQPATLYPSLNKRRFHVASRLLCV